MSGFKFKVAYGAWINDMNNKAMTGKGWPCLDIDEQAENDIIENIDLQSKAGFDYFEVWGLLVALSWPLDIKSAVDEKRKLIINRVIKAAHDRGMKVITGIGVYSWGFNEIIKNCPDVGKGTNQYAMCGSSDESWEWMKKILDFVLSEYDQFDGIHIESADLGRCDCEDCKKVNEIEYHCKIDIRVADYIKERKPGMIVMTTTCGFKLIETESEFANMIELSKHIDFLVIPAWWYLGCNMNGDVNKKRRIDFIKSLKCDFGNSGGTWVYPPQRWDRLRWFLPVMKRTGENIKQLFDEGGKVCEYYMSPAINPGVEANILFGGKILSHPERRIEDVIYDTVNELYKPFDSEVCRKIADIFMHAEDAYFNNTYDPMYFNGIHKFHQLVLTDLWGTEPGPPAYLSTYDECGNHIVYMDYKNRIEYKKALLAISDEITEVEDKIGERAKIGRIKKCIVNIIKDMDDLGYAVE
ncbi:MAG: hypothetical protein ACYCYI_03430 [Saccharofermentanales bacterium]